MPLSSISGQMHKLYVVSLHSKALILSQNTILMYGNKNSDSDHRTVQTSFLSSFCTVLHSRFRKFKINVD